MAEEGAVGWLAEDPAKNTYIHTYMYCSIYADFGFDRLNNARKRQETRKVIHQPAIPGPFIATTLY